MISRRFCGVGVALGMAIALVPHGFAQDLVITIRAATLLDGRGGVRHNITLVVRDGKIERIDPSPASAQTPPTGS